MPNVGLKCISHGASVISHFQMAIGIADSVVRSDVLEVRSSSGPQARRIG